MRIYAIGDVHGRSDLLSAKLDAIEAMERERPSRQRVVLTLGDYIDRGFNARQTIDLLLARRHRLGLITLAGNHEGCFLQFLRGDIEYRQWHQLGAAETLRSYGVPVDLLDALTSGAADATDIASFIPDDHVVFLRELALSYTAGDYYFVHAGVRPGVPLDQQRPADLMWIREEFLESQERFGAIVVHGHTPVPKPDIQRNRINIDTGAYITGRLTCLVLEGEDVGFL